MNGDDQCSAQALPSWSVTVIVVHSCWMLIAHQIFSLHDDNEKTENNSYFHSDQLLDRQINNDLFSLIIVIVRITKVTWFIPPKQLASGVQIFPIALSITDSS